MPGNNFWMGNDFTKHDTTVGMLYTLLNITGM